MNSFAVVLIIFTLLVFLGTMLEHIARTKFPKPLWRRALLQLMVIIPALIITVWLLPTDYEEHFLAVLLGLGIGIFAAEWVKRRLAPGRK